MSGPFDPRSRDRAFALACLALSCAACSGDRPTVVHPPRDGAVDGGRQKACPTHSGYPGDELCIEPPLPSEGIQLHYGPSSYDDPAAVAPFVLQPDEAVTDCFFVKTPNDAAMPVGEVHERMRPVPGETLILSVGGPDHVDGVAPCPSGPGNFWIGSRFQTFDFPTKGPVVPENVGLAATLPARTQAAINVHFENATPEPLLREAWINLVWHDPATVTSGLGSIEFIGGLGMSVPPGATRWIRGTASAPRDVRIVGLTGHFHTHTRRFTAWKAVGTAPNDAGQGPRAPDGGPADAGAPPPGDWGKGVRTRLVEAYDWADEGSRWFDSVHQNPSPDATKKLGGGVSGLVELKQGDRVDWECEVVNDLPTTTLLFSDALRTGEMCNVFGSYAPSDRSPDAPLWSQFQ